jgi:hypothetical protein
MDVKTYSDEEVDHEEYIEGEVYLLGCVLCPRNALLHSLTKHYKDSLNGL